MLKKANIFREGDEWFMHLEYECEDNRGKHLVTLPKVDFPCSLWYAPNLGLVDLCNCMATNELAFIKISDSLNLHEDNVTDPLTNKTINAFYTDIIVEPKIHDLTLDEIEKKLGYKVRIVADTKGE
mgnify:FL=1|jgi:hypothetical protein|nr:MAG TPA: hypothetical protein [Caudoviricetes sp.]